MIERDDEGRVGFQTAAMAVVVVLALVSTVVSGYAARESNQAADRTREIAKCNQEILERTVEALRQRTAFSDESAAAERKVLHTQSHLVDAMLQPAPSTTTLIGLARKYQSAVDDREDLLQRNKNRRDRFPYPTPEQIQECD